LVTWLLGRWIGAARDGGPLRASGLSAKARANIGSLLVVVGVVALRLYGPLFGGLTIMAHPAVDEVAKLLGVAYVALKLHHYLRLVLYDPKQQLSPLGVLNYCLYLPTLSSGPILRVRDWREMTSLEARWSTLSADLSIGVRRIIWGL